MKLKKIAKVKKITFKVLMCVVEVVFVMNLKVYIMFSGFSFVGIKKYFFIVC